MPSGKQNAITVSFSEKNKDVYKLLLEYKENLGKSFIQNDFICEAVRFYVNNKDKSFSNLDEDRVRKIIDEKFEEFKKEFVSRDMCLDLDKEKEEFNNKALEENLDMNPLDLEDD